MFRKNHKHTQPALISAISDLPENQRQRLEQSRAGTFYRTFFCRINEGSFAALYSDQPSRPNVPVNVLVGLEALKVGFGWSDEELYEAFLYNLQVRYALGYDRLGDGEFELRTVYNFRRLSEYNLKQGVNLLEQAFEAITDAQSVELKIRTGCQRMDSTHRQQHSGRQPPALAGGRHSTPASPAHRRRTSPMARSICTLSERDGWTVRLSCHTGTSPTRRADTVHVAGGHESQIRNTRYVSSCPLKENRELPAGSLQSLDDLEATYHVKGTQHYKGYVANVTETCDPENEVQLITKVQAAPNNAADPTLLNEALPDLKARTALHTLITDGGFPSETNDQDLHDLKIRLIQTGIRGAQPDPNRFNLTDFQIEQDAKGQPTCVSCPNRQTAVTARCNLHARILYGRDDHHKAEALFKALARALDKATTIDGRRQTVPSTKGTLTQ